MTVVALKRQIRTLLPPDAAGRNLRLIHAGKALSDASRLSALLKYPSASTQSLPSDPGQAISTTKGKEKAHAQDDSRRERHAIRLYIHCSVGDSLSAEALAAEAVLAESTQAQAPASPTSREPDQATSTTLAPTGFDRLLATGFSASEVASLRAQFMALQSRAYTPDTMPSTAEMRLLEDRWIDESANAPAGGGSGGGGFGDLGGADGGSYEDMLIGNVLGFFWPLGALVWLLREEGVWNGRRQMAVFTGIMVNLAFSLLRVAVGG